MELTEQIPQVHADSRRIYGSPRAYRQLNDQGESGSENTLAKLMRESGLPSKTKKAFKVKTTNSQHD